MTTKEYMEKLKNLSMQRDTIEDDCQVLSQFKTGLQQ